MKKLTQNVKCVALALDGMSLSAAKDLLEELFSSKNSIAKQMIAMIKLNDMLHGHSIDELRGLLNYVPEGIGFFLDLKLADVSKTCGNIAKRYAPLHPVIITVRENVSPKALVEIHRALPDTTIALVSALTDISEEDFLRDYGMSPLRYIIKHVDKFEQDPVSKNLLGAIVCSTVEIARLNLAFSHLKFVVPGVRDDWMSSDHQERKGGIACMLMAGATIPVMGAQLTKGNPDVGISPEESRCRTFEQIKLVVHGSFVNV